MRKNLTNFVRCGFLVGALCVTGGFVQAQSPSGNPSGQSPSSAGQSPSSAPGSPGSMSSPSGQTTADQMQQQTDQHMDNGAKKMAKSGDEAFAIKAAQGGAAEVKLGKLAAEKASDADVKAFGQQMVDDHTKANEQLASVAKEKSMTLPTDLDPKMQGMYEKLSAMSGADFDKAYVKHMVKDHEEDVKLFTKESTKGKDEKIKGFATETLPVLQGHLDKIKTLQSKVSSSHSTK